MHPSVMDFLRKNIIGEEFEGKRVLEIGSIYWDVSPRDIIIPLKPALYIGIDERPGKGVDEVRSANELSNRFEPGWFDAVVCTEVLEHAKNWRLLIEQIKYVLKPGGVLYLTCRGEGYPYHEEPNDFWRFSVKNMEGILSDMICFIEPDPQFPGVFAKAFLSQEALRPAKLYSIFPKPIYPPTHHLSHKGPPVDQSIKFTVITATILRPSLKTACRRLEAQTYKNWEHIVMIDTPGADIPEWLPHPQRKIRVCPIPHNNVGNSCRSNAWPLITGDYVIYLDDDNHYHSRSLALLAEAIMRMSPHPEWGVFPMARMGKIFFNVPPGKNKTDTGQFFHKPIVRGIEIRYLPINDYAADGEMVEKLSRICKPAIINPEIPLINMPVRSFGLRSDYFAKTEASNFSVIIPNRFEDIIRPLIHSIKLHEQDPCLNVLIVGDCHSRDYGFSNLRLDYEKFIFSRNVNAGIRYVDPDDVILVNDDIRLIMPTFQILHRIMQENPKIGILTPLVDGGVGNPKQVAENVLTGNTMPPELTYSACTKDDYLTFPIVCLKRKLLNEMLFNEDFVSYGKDDADFCIRAGRLGWKAAVYNWIVCQHGSGGSENLRGKNWNTSFMRRPELLVGEDVFSKIHK
jgi:SAM-dependent methyltransferase/glycosyltransferase involved in cell wall biosynthesis